MEKLWAEISTKHVTEELKAKSRKFQGKKSDTEKKKSFVWPGQKTGLVIEQNLTAQKICIFHWLVSKHWKINRIDPRPEYNCPYHYAETLGSGH